MTRLYSAASMGKAALRSMGIRPLFEQQPDISLEKLGPWMSAYFGGRSDVRVRCIEHPNILTDFTSNYPTIFIAQDLQNILTAERLEFRDCTAKVRELLAHVCLEDLFDPKIWPQLNCVVKVQPRGEILPVRFKMPASPEDRNRPRQWQIAVTHYTAAVPAYYTLADCIAAVILGNRAPEMLEAIEVVPHGRQKDLRAISFRGDVIVDSKEQIFKTIVEQRYTAKANGNERLESSLKELANSAAYGVNAEINTHQPKTDEQTPGWVYGAWAFESPDVADERPGEYFNPIIASLVTGGARLRLAMLERMVTDRGGTYAFCDTDSLAIIAGENCPPGIPSLQRADVLEIIEKWDALNQYDTRVVPHILKLEYEGVRCVAISAKRYVLFRRDEKGLPDIVKPSESGLGALIDERSTDDPRSLLYQIWQLILADIDKRPFDAQHLRVAARRRVPLNRPKLLEPFLDFNRCKSFDDQVKPYGFLQTVTPALEGEKPCRPVAPFTKKQGEHCRVPWIDLETGEEINLDWFGSALAGTVPVQTIEELAHQYARHPEEKAADANGQPATKDTVGLLHRLHIVGRTPTHLGKEIDRICEEDDMSLDDQEPIRYEQAGSDSELEAALEILKQLPQAEVAAGVGITERRYRDIEHGRVRPRKGTREAILRFADEVGSAAESTVQLEPGTGWTASRDEEGEKSSQEANYPVWIALTGLILIVIVMVVGSTRNEE